MASYSLVSSVDDKHDLHLSSYNMQERLVALPDVDDEGSPVVAAASIPMIQVVAPATLPEGYEFDAAVGNTTVKVKVPAGGVEQGQTFQVPLPETLQTAIGGATQINVPVGHWKDGLCSIFAHGVCHPHFWTSCLCALLAAGQVIRRLHLNWHGRPATSVAQATRAFKILLGIVVLYPVVYYGMNFIEWFMIEFFFLSFVHHLHAWTIFDVLRIMWHWIYIAGIAVIVFRLRRYVRAKYAIPNNLSWRQGRVEDLCCSCFCPCLVTAQMLRHTTDYDLYPATCCTETGVPPHAPSIV